MPLTSQQASQELFDNYKNWSMGYQRVSNAPTGASQITRKTANTLKNQWTPGAKSNSWNQSSTTGYTTNDGVRRWVTLSVSGGGSVVDFHALWKNVSFLWHFKIVDG